MGMSQGPRLMLEAAFWIFSGTGGAGCIHEVRNRAGIHVSILGSSSCRLEIFSILEVVSVLEIPREDRTHRQ